MSLESFFSRYGSPSTEANFSRHYYFTRADRLNTAKRIADADKYAAQDIAELEELIADIKSYRQTLAARYAELDTMPYQFRLELERDRRYRDSKVYYYVRIIKLYSDGTSIQELCEEYAGAERKKAIQRFEEIKKQRPGIEATKDIAKSAWER